MTPRLARQLLRVELLQRWTSAAGRLVCTWERNLRPGNDGASGAAAR